MKILILGNYSEIISNLNIHTVQGNKKVCGLDKLNIEMQI